MPPVLDPVFVETVDGLVAEAASVVDAAHNEELPAWYLGDLAAWSGDPLDIDGIASAFNREGIGEAYGAALIEEDGTVGAAASSTLQSDYVATVERSFRLRHASPIRCQAHAAARRTGHTHAAGSLARVRSYAQDLLAAGQAGGGT